MKRILTNTSFNLDPNGYDNDDIFQEDYRYKNFHFDGFQLGCGPVSNQ